MKIYKNIIEAADNLGCSIVGDQICRNDIPLATIHLSSTLVNCRNHNIEINESTTVMDIEDSIINSQYALESRLINRLEQAFLLLDIKILKPWQIQHEVIINKCWAFYETNDNITLLTWDDATIVATSLDKGNILFRLSPLMSIEDILIEILNEKGGDCEDEGATDDDAFMAELKDIG